MRLIHFSEKKLKDVVAVPQESRGFKPRGLWVSDEDDYGWRAWCLGEGFRVERLAVAHEVKLYPESRVLYVKGEAQLHALASKYGNDDCWGDRWETGWDVRWDLIAKRHQGIVISPYLAERRFDPAFFWYYAWDCASGCIWDPTAIESIKVVDASSLTHERIGGA